MCRVVNVTLCLQWMGGRQMTSIESLNDHITRRKMVTFNTIKQVQYLGIKQRKCFRPLYVRTNAARGKGI